MNTLTIEGWCKPDAAGASIPIGELHFRVDEEYHTLMEQAEENMAKNHEPETLIDVDINTMELQTSNECGELTDCKFRVYLTPDDDRGHFHLVAKRASDNALVYSNAVMIDQLG